MNAHLVAIAFFLLAAALYLLGLNFWVGFLFLGIMAETVAWVTLLSSDDTRD